MSDQPSVWNKQHRSTDMDTWGEDAEYVVYDLKGLQDMRRALSEGADPNERRALLVAVDRGSVSQVNALLKAGAHTDHFNEDGYSPLHLAVLNRSSEKVSALLKAGADVNAPVPQEVQQIVDYEPIVDHPDEPGHTAAMMAARQGDRAMIEQLRQHGASLDGVLHAAVIGDLEMVWRQETHVGPFRPHGPLVPQLLTEGWDPNTIDANQFRAFSAPGRRGEWIGGPQTTPLHLAAHDSSDHQTTTIDALIQAGGDPNRVDSSGNSPLHLAKTPLIAQCFLDAGGDPSIKNHAGQNAREANAGHKKEVAALYGSHLLKSVAQSIRGPGEGLASVEEVQARRSRGLRM